MLIACNSCFSKYLVNSADLKPDGRTVQCAKCGNQWFQEGKLLDEDETTTSSTLSTSKNFQSKNNIPNLPTPNLPSTYVKEEQVSIINSILVVVLLILLFFLLWVLKNLDSNSFVLINFYFKEFYFNLKLIFFNIIKIIYQIIN